MGKTPPKKEEADGSPRNKAARVDDPPLTTASAPSPTGKTPPKGEEAVGSSRKEAPRLDDAVRATVPGASPGRGPTGKTPLKVEAEGSPPKKSPRRKGVRPAAPVPLPTVPESSELIVEVAGRSSDEKRCTCNHVIPDSAIEKWESSLWSVDAWNCCGCRDEDREGIVKLRPEKSDLLFCVTCYDHLCCGVGSIAYPFGHSRAHARENEHWLAVLYGDPQRGYCFKCTAEVSVLVKSVSHKLPAPPPSVGALITASAPSLTGKTPLKGEAEGSLPKISQSPRRQDKWPAVRLATVPGSSELIVKGVGRASDEKRCECNHIITGSAIKELTNIQKMISLLESKDTLPCYGCSKEDNEGEGIVKLRPEKSDLLFCVTCYDHLCCGVGSIAYPFGHSRAHARENEHWLAVLYCVPEKGYCFNCDTEVRVPVKSVSQKLLAPTASEVREPVKFGKGGNEVGLQEIRDNAQGYAIRGLPNLGDTCYMSAILQCLFVLGKLQERMLALDDLESPLVNALKELFVEPNDAGDLVNLHEVLECIQDHRESRFKIGAMEDSHELLTALRELWNQGDARVIDSIFGFEMLQTLSCKKCGQSLTTRFEWDLKLDFPSKWHPTKGAASPQTSESPRSRKREIPVQLFPADVQRNLEKMQTDSESGYSRVDSTQVQRFGQSKDIVQSPLQIQEGKSVDSLTKDSISIEYLLWLFCKEVECSCPNCAKDHEEPSASQSKHGEQIVGSCNEDHVGDPVKTVRFIRLSPVLTLHVNRTSHHKGTSMVDSVGIKISGHVTFKEFLDVKQFKDRSSVDEGSTRYRLAGVVEHMGEESLESGHYIAYVARRLGNQQGDSSCSSSWFRADDTDISQVSLKKVLSCQAYILFYERMEEA